MYIIITIDVNKACTLGWVTGSISTNKAEKTLYCAASKVVII